MSLIDAQSLKDMAAYIKNGHSTTCWAAYQNTALDSAGCGQLQFLAVGPCNTHETPPDCYPADTQHGAGWRYRFVGWVDLATGIIRPTSTPRTFWDEEDQEHLTYTDPDDAIEALLDQAENLPSEDEQVTVYEYAPRKVDEQALADWVLEGAL